MIRTHNGGVSGQERLHGVDDRRPRHNNYPAEGYGIKYEGSFLGEKSESGWRKVRVVVFRFFFIFFVSTTFGHN